MSRISVVVIDDAPSIRLLLSRTLPLFEIDVVGEAGTLHEGLGITEREQPDVVLLDEHLPDGLGSTELLAFREAAPGAKILMFTNEDSPGTLSRASEGGAAGYILKISLIPNIAREIERVVGAQEKNAATSEPGDG